jgi:hypothetical protein
MAAYLLSLSNLPAINGSPVNIHVSVMYLCYSYIIEMAKCLLKMAGVGVKQKAYLEAINGACQ